MTKADLISVVATKTDMKKKDAEVAVNAAFEAIVEALTAGDKVAVAGFGSFEVKEVAAREARNPKTQEVIKVPATKKPAFSPSKPLKELVKG